MDAVRLFEILMKASAAIATAGFAAVVLRQAPRRNQNRYLAVFLFLISANQLIETWIVLRKVEDEIGVLAALIPPLSPTVFDRLALIFAASDPFVLYYFASIYPTRTRLNHPIAVALVGAASLSFLVYAHDFVLARDRWLILAWESFNALVYLTVWMHFLRPLIRGESSDGARPLYYAMCVAALPLVPRAGRALQVSLAPGQPSDLAIVVIPSLILVGGIVLLDRLRRHTSDRAMSKGALLGGGVIIIGFLPWFVDSVSPLAPWLVDPSPIPWYAASAALRWLLFSLLVSVAVFRHDILGMRLQARRRAGRAAALFAALIGTVFLYAALSLLTTGSVRVRALDVILVGAVVALSPDLRRFIATCADRLYGVPPSADKRAAADTYRTAVLQALRDGRGIPDDPDLSRLRGALGIAPETASWVESSVLNEPSTRSLNVGTSFQGRYQVRTFLGRGGAGRAFLARDPLLNRDVVLKEVAETTRTQGEHLLRESQAAARVHHPNVMAIHDVVPQTGRVIMVTEFLTESLNERIARDGPLPLEAGTRIFSEVLAGLAAVHAEGMVHRDLKPANIFIARDGTAKIGDFGIATDAAAITLASDDPGFSGTPGYLAPEVLSDGTVTPLADVYAVARMMRSCLDDHALEALGDIIARGAAADPADRYASAHAMLCDLQAATLASTDSESGPPPAASDPGTSGRPRAAT